MSDFPWMKFFSGDWVSDPALSLCSPATRGIWVDVICAMHARHRSGELIGKVEQLARICRCNLAEMTAAIAELDSTGTADVTDRNGIVTLVCRRMQRECDGRKSGALRAMKHRNKVVTSASTNDEGERNAKLTDTRASESEIRGQKIENTNTKTAAYQPALLEVIEAGKTISCPQDVCERFYEHYQSTGWLTQHNQPITDWKSRLALWHRDNRSKNKPEKGNSRDAHKKALARGSLRLGADRNAGNANGESTSNYHEVEKCR